MAAWPAGEQLIDIDPEGDLILKIGGISSVQQGANDRTIVDGSERNDNDEGGDVRCLRVTSKVMKLASTVFKTMLQAERFLEGWLALNEDIPPYLALPDDDPAAMTTLCRIIHSKQKPSYATIISDILNLAILTDKYDCVPAIQPWFTSCLNQELSTSGSINVADLPHMLSAAYLFDDRTSFYGLTMAAIKSLPMHNSSTNALNRALLPTIASELVVEDVRHHSTLKTTRQERLRHLVSNLHQSIYHLLNEKSSIRKTRVDVKDLDGAGLGIWGLCKGQASRVGILTSALVAVRLWPHDDVPTYSLAYAIHLALRIAETCETDGAASGIKYELCGKTNCVSCSMNWKESLRTAVRRSEESIAGICLTCFKKGNKPDRLTEKCKYHCGTYPATTWTVDVSQLHHSGGYFDEQ
ncbi:hypothetical protein LTS07_011064 [Exophiala sideris]|uniref:BTB domain-containing protein n=1 Tax=Exophiala sideris TaxID=1016849 RepID=A0ABR0IVX0_9EURO|nr:hypothetical protein LTS07_011064 [Exophiala sideris]KAK5024269.1 hypothetical protein LTR13_010890 [Exophiala sideris]KAK5049212.1 hypothetical protein LTR69_011087 [Exophiala sideris]KAK5176524.1 hypothetical protein LTR44_010912 [Eurotiomycetes sp. CCFEE 6388]